MVEKKRKPAEEEESIVEVAVEELKAPEEIVKAIKGTMSRLGKTDFDASGFLKKLYAAYRRYTAFNNLANFLTFLDLCFVIDFSVPIR